MRCPGKYGGQLKKFPSVRQFKKGDKHGKTAYSMTPHVHIHSIPFPCTLLLIPPPLSPNFSLMRPTISLLRYMHQTVNAFTESNIPWMMKKYVYHYFLIRKNTSNIVQQRYNLYPVVMLLVCKSQWIGWRVFSGVYYLLEPLDLFAKSIHLFKNASLKRNHSGIFLITMA